MSCICGEEEEEKQKCSVVSVLLDASLPGDPAAHNLILTVVALQTQTGPDWRRNQKKFFMSIKFVTPQGPKPLQRTISTEIRKAQWADLAWGCTDSK